MLTNIFWISFTSFIVYIFIKINVNAIDIINAINTITISIIINIEVKACN